MSNKLKNIKNSGFKTPKDYFQNMEDQIMSNIKLDNTLEGLKNTSFKAPEGYFDSLEDLVLDKVTQTNKPKVISLFSTQNLIYISGVAAAVLIMFGIFWNNTEISMDTIDTELVENYFIDEGIDTYEIASLFLEDDLTIEDGITDIDIFDNTFNEDFLENYLLENANLEDIIDQ